RTLTAELVAAAGALPFTGPNCYGLVNFFDRIALWPDQVVGEPLERGVAILTQSGTIALRSEEHTSELQSLTNLGCRLLLEKQTRSSCSPSPLPSCATRSGRSCGLPTPPTPSARAAKRRISARAAPAKSVAPPRRCSSSHDS